LSAVVTEFYKYTSSHLVTLVVLLALATGFTLAGSFYAVIEAKEAQATVVFELAKVKLEYEKDLKEAKDESIMLSIRVANFASWMKARGYVETPTSEE